MDLQSSITNLTQKALAAYDIKPIKPTQSISVILSYIVTSCKPVKTDAPFQQPSRRERDERWSGVISRLLLSTGLGALLVSLVYSSD